jgi:hypothetical protein
MQSIVGRYGPADFDRIMYSPDPSELPLLLKVSAITWTSRPLSDELHIVCLNTRARYLTKGRPAPGDTKETLTRLLKRAVTELAWPELPQGTSEMFEAHFGALSMIAELGEPEAAVEILSRHVEDVESKVVDRKYAAKYYIYRSNWLLSAAWKVRGDEGKRGAYVTEARGVMERATRSLRVLQPEDWGNALVRASTPSENCLIGA